MRVLGCVKPVVSGYQDNWMRNESEGLLYVSCGRKLVSQEASGTIDRSALCVLDLS